MNIEKARRLSRNKGLMSHLPEKRKLVILRKVALGQVIDTMIVPILVKQFLAECKSEDDAEEARVLSELRATPIPGFDGYGATRDGQIWSLKRGKWKKMVPQMARNGYMRVFLTTPDKKSACSVASLIALTFIGPRPRGQDGHALQINHKDMVKRNNAAWNLEYLTQAENFLHAQSMLKSRPREMGRCLRTPSRRS